MILIGKKVDLGDDIYIIRGEKIFSNFIEFFITK